MNTHINKNENLKLTEYEEYTQNLIDLIKEGERKLSISQIPEKLKGKFQPDENSKILYKSIYEYALNNYPQVFLQVFSLIESNKLGVLNKCLEFGNAQPIILALRRFWIQKIFFSWNNKISFNEINNETYNLLIPNIKEEIFLLQKTFSDEDIQERLLEVFYPNIESNTDGFQILEQLKEKVIENYKYLSLNVFFKPDKLNNFFPEEDLDKNKIQQIIIYLLSILKYRQEIEKMEIICLGKTKDGIPGYVSIASLELTPIPPENEETNNNKNIFVLASETNLNLSDIMKVNIITAISKTIEKLKNKELKKFQYLLIIRPTFVLNNKITFSGDSIHLPIVLTLYSAKKSYTPVTMEMGISCTGEIDFEKADFEVKAVDGFDSKFRAIELYNKIYSFNPIKALYIPNINDSKAKEILDNLHFEIKDNYYDVKETNQIYYETVSNINEIKFIELFKDYLDNLGKDKKSFKQINEKTFKNEYDSLNGDFNGKTFFDENPENQPNLISKDGYIIPCYPFPEKKLGDQDPEPQRIATFLCSFLAEKRENKGFSSVPVPVMVKLEEIVFSKDQNIFKSNILEYLSSQIKEVSISKDTIRATYNNPHNFVFVAYSDAVGGETFNDFYPKILKQLKDKHYLVAVANCLEQANFWNKEITPKK